MAKKKSKEDWKKEGTAVKALFAAAKKKEHNCAIVICAEGLAIEADPRLPADNLKKKARKRDGATPKGVTGKLKINGTSIEVTCLEEPPGGIESKFKQYLAKIGVKMKPVLIVPQEEAAEAVEDAPAEAAVAEEEAESDIGAILEKARKKPHNAAWLLSDAGLVLKAHPRLPLEKLQQQAKGEGGGQRGALGVMTVSGKTVTLTCEEEPPGNFARLAKAWMAEQGHAYKVRVSLPDGGELTDGEDDEADEAAGATPPSTEGHEETHSGDREAAAETEAQDREAAGAEEELSEERLAAELAHVKEIFELSYEGMDPEQAKQLKAALENVSRTLASGDLAGAQNILNKLGLLTGVTADSPLEPITMAAPSEKSSEEGDRATQKQRKKELTKELADLKPELLRHMSAASPEQKKLLQDMVKTFGVQMKAMDIDDAQTTFASLREKLTEATEGVTEGSAEGAEENGELSEEKRANRMSQLDELEQSLQSLISGLGGMEALRQTDGI